MSTESRKKLHDIYNVIQIIFIILSAVCIIISCMHLFLTGGDKPYSRQIISEYLKYVCIPIFITVALIIGGFILNIIYPQDKAKSPANKYQKFKEAKISSKLITILRICVFAVSIGFITYGFFSGGALAVLTKAINICTECIGLG